jgi:hypothetical protein
MSDQAFLLVTLALVLVHLARNGIWYDEAASLLFAG